MPVETPVPTNHPMMKAWILYQGTDEYKNTARWAATNTRGSMWAAFVQGWEFAMAYVHRDGDAEAGVDNPFL